MTYETHNRRDQQRNWRRRKFSASEGREVGFGLVEKMFWNYEKIKRAVEDARMELGFYSSGGKTGGAPTNHSFVSDPTAILAMRHSAPIKQVTIDGGKATEETVKRPEDWLFVVEQTYRRFLDLHHEAGDVTYPVLIDRFRNEPWPTTCARLEITKDKYYSARDVGIRYARECAIQLGLLKVF